MDSAIADESNAMILGSSISHNNEFHQEQFDINLNNQTVCYADDGDPLRFIKCYTSSTELAGTLVKAFALGLIILFTIFGNVLVLLSVAVSRNLRSSTHYLIVNLACADLLLGLAVLPFSAVFEVTGRWYFGPIFCTMWAAVDVLCCTSSILSLCVISLDRYIGVTRPLAYSSIMVGKRTSFLILLIWTLSIAISIGPLLGWKEPPSDDPYFCTVNKQLGYVLFSVTGSFYLPMFVIIGVYWKIYKAAIRQTKFLECGSKTTKQDITLRVHLGGNRMKFNPNLGNKFGGGCKRGGGDNVDCTPRHQHHHNHNRPCASSGGASQGSDGDLSIAAAELNNLNLNNGVNMNLPNLLSLAPLARPEKSSTSSVGTGGGIEMNNIGDPAVVLRVHRGGGGTTCHNNAVPGSPANNGRLCCQKCTGNNKKHQQHSHLTTGGRNVNDFGKNAHHPQQQPNDHNNQHRHGHNNHHHINHNNGSQANSSTPSPPSSSPERKLNESKLNPGFGKNCQV